MYLHVEFIQRKYCFKLNKQKTLRRNAHASWLTQEKNLSVSSFFFSFFMFLETFFRYSQTKLYAKHDQSVPLQTQTIKSTLCHYVLYSKQIRKFISYIKFFETSRG